jgi:hypothetical protein
MYLERAETWRGLAEYFERPQERGKEFGGDTEPRCRKIGVDLVMTPKKETV